VIEKEYGLGSGSAEGKAPSVAYNNATVVVSGTSIVSVGKMDSSTSDIELVTGSFSS
jgi:hypothetical protein